jgi:hypothetical protein
MCKTIENGVKATYLEREDRKEAKTVKSWLAAVRPSTSRYLLC